MDQHLRVRDIDDLCADVREFTLVPADPSTPLASYVPGSHIAVQAGGVANTYSLTDDGVMPDAYRISVRRQGTGGGSAWLHTHVAPGDLLAASSPRSRFPPVTTARHHLFVAAGIGITPILSHLRSARRWNRSFELIYGVSIGNAPHRTVVGELAGANGRIVEGRDAIRGAVDDALSRQPVGTHVYACGPAAFLEGFAATAMRLGWPDERVHIERFATPSLDAGTPFTAVLTRSGLRLEVPSGVSLLQALDAAGVAIPRLCMRGVCGECRTGVIAGKPDHRDLVLSAAERERNDALFPCVSRACSPELELDL